MIDAYVIKLAGIESSEALADECKTSGLQFGIDIKDFNGIYGEQEIERHHQLYNIKPWKPKMKKHRIGVKGCFLSHYSLWLQSLNTQKPILIFEHDAVMIRPLPENILNLFDEFLMLDPYNKMRGTYKEYHETIDKNGIEEYYNNDVNSKYGVLHQYVMGLQAYIIKPKAAYKLVKEVQSKGYYPADIQCHKGILNIQTVYPSVGAINPKFWNNKKLMKQESSTHKTWSNT